MGAEVVGIEEKRPVGRPTKYKPEYCGRTLNPKDARKLRGNIVYGLCYSGEDDVFYIGSTRDAPRRFGQYINGAFHGNLSLRDKIKKQFMVYIFHHGDDDYREKEYDLIIKNKNKVVNIRMEPGSNSNFGEYVKIYKARYGNTEFIREMKNFYDELSEEDKIGVNIRMKNQVLDVMYGKAA